MAYQKVGIGSTANDGTGDTLRVGADKINENFEDLFAKINGVANSAISDGTALTSADVVLTTSTDTLTNKTLTAPTINGVVGGTATSQTITTLTTAGITGTGGALEVTPANNILEIRGDGSNVEGQIQLNCHQNTHGQILRAQPHSAGITNTMLLPIGASSTLVSLVSEDTLTNKTLTSPVLTTPQVNDTSADHQYVFAVSELAADRTVTLPLLATDDEFVFKDHIQTLTNKTLTSATLTGLFGSVQTLTGAGAVDLTNTITEITSTGTDALTLANGVAGQVKIITMIVDGGDATLQPTTFADGTNILFDDVGESVVLVYHNTIGWKAVSVSGATIS